MLSADCSLIHRRLSWRTGLPAAMDPEPLLRIAGCIAFNHLAEGGGILDCIALLIAGPDQLDGRIEAYSILAQRLIPNREGRYYGCIRVQRYAGYTGGGVRGHSKEIDERSLGRSHVCIHQNAYGLPSP